MENINEITDMGERAVYFKHHGSNCLQSVLRAYGDKISLTDDQIKTLGAGFGAGMGGMEGTCGALVGAVMVKGMIDPSMNPMKAKAMVEEFKKESGAVRCRDLKGIDTGVMLCPCDQCIRNAVSILEK